MDDHVKLFVERAMLHPLFPVPGTPTASHVPPAWAIENPVLKTPVERTDHERRPDDVYRARSVVVEVPTATNKGPFIAIRFTRVTVSKPIAPIKGPVTPVW
jgi:hypothetical protein